MKARSDSQRSKDIEGDETGCMLHASVPNVAYRPAALAGTSFGMAASPKIGA